MNLLDLNIRIMEPLFWIVTDDGKEIPITQEELEKMMIE